MKGTRGRLRHGIALFLAVGLTSAAASADVWVTGAICDAAVSSDGTVFDRNGGSLSNNTANSRFAVCPIPVTQNVGTSQQFEMRVQDSSAQNFTSCLGVVIGTDGEILASTNSGQTNGQGEFTISMSTNTGVSSDDYSYVAFCTVPGNGSSIENLRVF